jgi:predicted TIM-barrel fold metal-dependent hydrolase
MWALLETSLQEVQAKGVLMYNRTVPREVAIRLSDPEVGFDTHCHVFNHENVPNGFLGVRLPFTDRFLNVLEGLTKFVGGALNKDSITNISYFLDMFEKDTSAITKALFTNGYYPASTIFCPLSMDMAGSIKGKTARNLEHQLLTLKTMMNVYKGRMLPFLALNPANPDMSEMFAEYVEGVRESNIGWCWGVKIYPALGYLPTHYKLQDIFEVCERLSIPVTTHCSNASVHSTHRRIDGKWYWTKKDYSYFTEPKKWLPVLKDFPKLRLNFGHFGGYEQWRNYAAGKNDSWVTRIVEFMHQYDNVYADLSYTFSDRKIHPVISQVLHDNSRVASRALWGSDYYMVTMEGHLRDMLVAFRLAMGDRIMHMLTVDNPRQFLFTPEQLEVRKAPC